MKIVYFSFISLLLAVGFVYALAIDNAQTIVELRSRGNDKYTLDFINRQDTYYRIPYISNDGGTFKYGDDNKDLVFIEGNFSESMTFADVQQTPNVFNVGLLDYVVLSNVSDASGNDETAVSHIIRYNSIDTAERILSFDEEGSGTQEFTYEPLDLANGAAIGKVYLRFGENNYTAYVANTSQWGYPLAIDMNKDGQINRAEIRSTTIKGNILDFGDAEESDGGNFSYTNDTNSYNYGTYVWSNTGDIITSSDTSDFTFLTKRRTLGHLPIIDQTVTTHIQTQPQNTLNITSVEGRHFTLLPPEDRQRTAYGFLFELYPDEGSTNFRSSYARRR